MEGIKNILFDFDPHDFSVDDIFHIGDTQVQITQICTVCNHLSVFSKELPFLLKNHRGLYCKILNGGIILKDSIVKISGKKPETILFLKVSFTKTPAL